MRRLALTSLLACSPEIGPAPSPHEIRAVNAPRLPRDAADDPAWNAAPEHVAPLLVQDIAEPKLMAPGVPQVAVRALHDGKWIAFRLSWQDGTRDVVGGNARFADAASVQVPLGAPRGSDVPDAAMGAAGRPVRILYWRASWQETRDPVAALYPNTTIDHYQPAFAADAQQPGRAAVQDLVAEGFGTLTPRPEQQAVGRGTWKAGTWATVIALPLDGPGQGTLVPGTRTFAALAVWDGGAGNAGSKKMRSQWVPLALDAVP